MKISLKSRCKTFIEINQMIWETMDVIFLVVQMELEKEGYIVSNKYSGEGNNALMAALSSDDGSQIPEIYVFLPNARLIPPDMNSCIVINFVYNENNGKETLISDVIISYQNNELTNHADFIINSISTTIKP